MQLRQVWWRKSTKSQYKDLKNALYAGPAGKKINTGVYNTLRENERNLWETLESSDCSIVTPMNIIFDLPAKLKEVTIKIHPTELGKI